MRFGEGGVRILEYGEEFYLPKFILPRPECPIHSTPRVFNYSVCCNCGKKFVVEQPSTLLTKCDDCGMRNTIVSVTNMRYKCEELSNLIVAIKYMYGAYL